MVTKQSRKRRDIVQLLINLVVLVLLNYIFGFLFIRFDLTSEKRYSLSDATKTMLGELDDVVLVKVYLDGDLPAGFKHLKDETKEILDEFRAYSNNNIDYVFINPGDNPDQKTRNEVYKQLYDKGLLPTDLEVKSEDGVTNKIIWPGAIIAYKGKERPLQLLKSQMGSESEVMLNNSIQQLEYELSGTIRRLSGDIEGKIGFLEGHGELDALEVADITKSLKELYSVDRIEIGGQLNKLLGYKALIIAKPDSTFNNKDKFIIDQFIMKGGKVLWLIDAINANMDSLVEQNTTIGLSYSVNLEDQLFKYGVRINPDLILDLRSMPIPIVTGFVGNQPKQDFFPWFYFPLIVSTENHPIVNNMEAVKTEFVSSMDTAGGKDIKKTILLSTSNYTKTQPSPVRISLNMLRQEPDRRQFNQQKIPLAVLLEGEFESVFKNRIPPQIKNDSAINFLEKSIPTKQIVVSDGDIIKNRVNRERGRYYAMEFDKYTQRAYGNKDFILNCINYLCDDSGLISARSKQFKIRLLDTQKVNAEKTKWQLINTVIPVVLIAFIGLIQLIVRRKKYSL